MYIMLALLSSENPLLKFRGVLHFFFFNEEVRSLGTNALDEIGLLTFGDALG